MSVAHMKKIAEILLDTTGGDDWERKDIALKSYHKILSDITGIKGAIKERDEGFETALATGLALSPGHAADCTLDVKRTVKYLHALDGAIRTIRARNPGETVNVVYAGTGPFAPFAIPVAFRYSSDEVKFTALDIHPASLDALRHVVAEFGLGDHFNEFVECDATEYIHHGRYPLHILITETMHRTLSREPHVMITLNLARQLVDDGVVIPESVRIEAVLSEIGKEVKYLDYGIDEAEMKRVRYPLGTVFEVGKDTYYDFGQRPTVIDGPVCRVDFDIGDRKLLVLLTEIRLFGDIELREKESGITHPYFVQEIGNVERGDSIGFSFNLSQYPKMICAKLRAEPDPLAALERL